MHSARLLTVINIWGHAQKLLTADFREQWQSENGISSGKVPGLVTCGEIWGRPVQIPKGENRVKLELSNGHFGPHSHRSVE